MGVDPALWIVSGTLATLALFLWALRWFDPERPRVTLTPDERLRKRHHRLTAAALLVFTLGTFVWRVRTSQQLSETPVDAAASWRLIADGLALVLVGMAEATRRRLPHGLGDRSLLLVFYGIYIATIVLSATQAVVPSLVIFRAAELAVCLVVAWAVARSRTVEELVSLARRVLFFLAALVGLSVVLAPEQALLSAFGGTVPFRLEGVYPAMSSNTVGFIGMLLFAIGLGSRSKRLPAIAIGLVLVALTQYRTGYVAIAAILIAYLIGNRNVSRKLLVVLAVPALIFIATSSYFREAWQRGEIVQRSAETLSGRTTWWQTGLDVVDRSPYLGTGLTSGTRYEVLSRLGSETTSSIHSTWLEVYVGMGLLGAVAFSLVIIRMAWVSWTGRIVSLVPMLMFVAVLVRSGTGSTIELAGWPAALMVMMVLGLETERRRRFNALEVRQLTRTPS